MLAAGQTQGNGICLALSTSGWRMRSKVAGRGDERMRCLWCAAQQLVLAKGNLCRLDGVEVAILAQQCLAKGSKKSSIVASSGEVVRNEFTGLIDLLLAVQQR